MLATLRSEARHRGVPSCVLTFEPHPRDYFAALQNKPQNAPARITHLRDKLAELERCGIDQCVVLRFDAQLAALSAHDFVDQVLVRGLGVKYVLVGDDFKFGAKRSGDYAMLTRASGISQSPRDVVSELKINANAGGFKGCVDELQIWDGVLTSSQIKELANQEGG